MPYAVMLWQMYKTREGPEISKPVVSGMFLAETPSEQAVTRERGNCLRVLEGGGRERSSVAVAAGSFFSSSLFLHSCSAPGRRGSPVPPMPFSSSWPQVFSPCWQDPPSPARGVGNLFPLLAKGDSAVMPAGKLCCGQKQSNIGKISCC